MMFKNAILVGSSLGFQSGLSNQMLECVYDAQMLSLDKQLVKFSFVTFKSKCSNMH